MQYDKQDRFVIFDNRDLEKAKTELIKLLSMGLKYFHDHDDIYAIDKMYNTPPLNKQNPNCSDFDTQCVIGLISAKLARNGNYEQISSYYSNLIRSADMLQDTRNKFERIKKSIETL